MITLRTLACFAAIVLTHSLGAATTGGKAAQLALGGIKTVAVLIEPLPRGANLINLRKDQIQTDVELKLRQAGLSVENIDKLGEETGKPYLYVFVNITDDASAASVDVQLCQDAVLTRSPRSWMPSMVTWETGLLLGHPSADFVRSGVKDLVDRFLNAWLAANPIPR